MKLRSCGQPVSILTVKIPMTAPTKRNTIGQVVSLLFVRGKRVEMVRSESTAHNGTLLASVVVLSKDEQAPFLVNSPVSLSLPISRLFSFVIPVVRAVKPSKVDVLALCRASVLFSVRLIKHLFAAYTTIKSDSANVYVVRHSSKVGKTVFSFSLARMLAPLVPVCTLAFSQVSRAKPWYAKLVHHASNRPTCYTKLLSNLIRAHSLRYIQLFQFLLGGPCAHPPSLAPIVCTATNTWKRSAISTW